MEHSLLQPPKRLLMGPGPSPVEPRVYQALAKPIVGHLDPYFFEVAGDIRRLLQPVFGTANEYTLAISGTGTAGMETAVSNFVEAGMTAAVFSNGYFCERIAEMIRRQGASLKRLAKPWGEAFSDGEARDFIAAEKPHVVAFVHGETSTGVLQNGKAICEAAHQAGALVIADVVTSLGNVPVNVDETGIDIAYSCSQKGLACPPGLAPLTVSPRALEALRARKSSNRSFYLDLTLLNDYLSGRRYHHTAPISMCYALREALSIIEEEGLENRFRRIHTNHRAFVAGIEAMGLSMLVPEALRLRPLNTPCVPAGIDDAKVRQRLLNERGIEILGGFGPLAGKVFRIGIMGAGSTEENVLLLLDALDDALRKEGWRPRADARGAAEAFYGKAAQAAVNG
ncbi:MAG: alanine--glyoxylate aminotransferase family protein [Bryobacteraceae bacterium]|nr:alanine--glyoxylate aminotransferase family protein [Bryobacteraceae bacterium]